VRIDDVLKQFTIQVSNEEDALLDDIDSRTPLSQFNEREQFVIENLVRKSLVSKIVIGAQTLVVRNDIQSDIS
jgi:hypothetical protein